MAFSNHCRSTQCAPCHSPHTPSQYNENDLRVLQSLDMTRASQLIELGRKVDSIFTKDGQQYKSQLASNLTWIHRKFIEFYITETLEIS